LATSPLSSLACPEPGPRDPAPRDAPEGRDESRYISANICEIHSTSPFRPWLGDHGLDAAAGRSSHHALSTKHGFQCSGRSGIASREP